MGKMVIRMQLIITLFGQNYNKIASLMISLERIFLRKASFSRSLLNAIFSLVAISVFL